MPVTVDELNRSTSICFTTLANKIGVTPRKLLQEIKLIAFSDPADHAEVAEGGELRFKTFDEQGRTRRCIKSLKEKTVITESKDGEKIYKTSTVEYTLHDKLEAIDMAMALHGMKKPAKVEVNGRFSLDITEAKQKLLTRLNAIADRRGKGQRNKRSK